MITGSIALLSLRGNVMTVAISDFSQEIASQARNDFIKILALKKPGIKVQRKY